MSKYNKISNWPIAAAMLGIKGVDHAYQINLPHISKRNSDKNEI
jgi:hypothetical protein